MATPYMTVEVPQVASTQEEARRQFDDSAVLRPVLLIAAQQLRGRGRRGREWWTAPRAMTASLAMSEPKLLESLESVPLILGLSVRDAIASVCGVSAGLKWPNDLIVEQAKIGGLLVECAQSVVVAGVGVNLWWPDAPDGVAAIFDEDPGPDFARDLAHAWAVSFLAGVESGKWNREAYMACCVTIGQDVEWEPGGAGTAVGIDDTGGLIVDTVSGNMILRAEEVWHVAGTCCRSVGPAAALSSDERDSGV